jgi:hypothetical protein
MAIERCKFRVSFWLKLELARETSSNTLGVCGPFSMTLEHNS